MKNLGWDIIYNYLRERDNSEFGVKKVKITHVWTQDRAQSEKLARATKIQDIVENIEDMIDKVDGVINFQVESVMCVQAKHTSLILKNKDKFLIYIDVLGEAPRIF